MYRRIIIGLLCASLFWCCSKSDISYDSVYVVKPWTQLYNSSSLVSQPEVKVFAFSVDTADWRVASYEDALAGILTSKIRPEQQFSAPVAIGEPFGLVDSMPNSADWLKMPVSTMSLMVVVVNPERKLYAYTQQNFVENLSTLYVSVTFQLWRELKRYTNGSWVYVNEFYDPDAPKTGEYILKPRFKKTEKDTEVPIKNLTMYAYVVDTLDWYVASFEDALAGTITSKKIPAEKLVTPDYTSYVDKTGGDQGWRRLSVKDTLLMIVAVDPDHRNYAYRKQAQKLGGNPVIETLVFQPWREGGYYVDGSWRVFVTSLPQTDPDPKKPARR